MEQFNRGLSNCILEWMCSASENDMEPSIKEEIIKFVGEPHTDAEVYDFLDHISKYQCDRIGDKICVGYISGFVQSVCSVTPYYTRPNDGGEATKITGEV